jgi:cytochrome c peroxidase
MIAVVVPSAPRARAEEGGSVEPAFTIAVLDRLAALPGRLAPLPAVPVPADNPQDEAKIALGRRLFFETRLSRDRTQSCASCHDPHKGFTDGLPRGHGFEGRELPRNSPTILNAAYNATLFWDGRADSLEAQAQGPMLSAAEMNLTAEEVAARLAEVPEYRERFRQVFGAAPSLATAVRALAAYERTLVTGDSRFDRYLRGNKEALSAAEKRGLIVFIGKGTCTECHRGPSLTDERFHRIGLPAAGGDPGRYAVTARDADRACFKTPSLRNVALTAPYMHDGRLATLADVVEFYDKGAGHVAGQSPLIDDLELTAQEKDDLLAFLETLTGDLSSLRAEGP